MTFSGIFPALLTPVDHEERFLPAAFERLLERVYQAGCHGVYVNGFTGEGLHQPLEQRKRIAEVAARCSPPGRQVVIHVGAWNTADAVALARHASSLGVAAISSLPPAGGFSLAEIRSYYQAIAAASDVPVLVYYFPELNAAVSGYEAIRALLEIPNVAGFKFTDPDLSLMMRLREHCGTALNGRDEMLAAGLLMGADGAVGTFYSLAPDLAVALYGKARAGDWNGAAALQRALNRLIDITLAFPMLGAVKTMLRWSGIDCGAPIAPRAVLTPEQEARLREALEGFEASRFVTPGAPAPR